MHLQAKVEEAKERILKTLKYEGWRNLFLGHSGGKDSTVIYDLASECIPWQFKVVHNTKSDTHPDTVYFLYQLSLKRPIDFVPYDGMEGYLVRNPFTAEIDGSRKDEGTRADRSNKVVVAGHEINREEMTAFTNNGLFGLNFVFPIYDWTDEEVWEYIHTAKIPVSNEYRNDPMNQWSYDL